ncbi:hypothetical protein CNY89_29920, partial [Amaricoccus sp. HAR-UPW-R2A-40]
SYAISLDGKGERSFSLLARGLGGADLFRPAEVVTFERLRDSYAISLDGKGERSFSLLARGLGGADLFRPAEVV